MKQTGITWKKSSAWLHSEKMLQTFAIKVFGEVQGVFYRQRTKEKAIQIGIGGYVKNLPDGSVEIVATGTADQLKQLTNWCWQGSDQSIVTNVLHNELPLLQFEQFIIKIF